MVRDFALNKGISLSQLIVDSSITMEQLIEPPRLINNMLINGIGTNLLKNLKNPACEVVEFGIAMNTASHGSLGLAIQGAPDILSAYKIVAAYFNTRVNALEMALEEESTEFIVRITLKNDATIKNEAVLFFFDFASMISIACITELFTDQSKINSPLRIEVNRSEPNNFPHHLLPKSTIVHFDKKELKLIIPREWMELPLASANEEFAKIAMEKCQKELDQLTPSNLASKIREVIRNTSGRLPRLNEIAKELHMSPATFKRRLKEHGTSYQELKNEERFRKAKKLIGDKNLSIEEIAELLGFSDPSNFIKSFKSWSGTTPKAYFDSTASKKENRG